MCKCLGQHDLQLDLTITDVDIRMKSDFILVVPTHPSTPTAQHLCLEFSFRACISVEIRGKINCFLFSFLPFLYSSGFVRGRLIRLLKASNPVDAFGVYCPILRVAAVFSLSFEFKKQKNTDFSYIRTQHVSCFHKYNP